METNVAPMPYATPAAYLAYLVPIIVVWVLYLTRRRMAQNRALAARDDALASGMAEPASLHPVIDPSECVGCASCVMACPEQATHPVLGLVHGKASLVGPSHCIGHGACRAACPMGAITLVFGTERRGVDIPHVSPDFETNVPGIFIAGELGGMGLIRNAVEQGRQAMDTIRRRVGKAGPGILDVVIIGAGPAGFSASLAAMECGLNSVTLEQDSLGGTVFQFPRGKLVMTAPVNLPVVGKVRFTETSKEELLAFWQDVERSTGVEIRYRQRVETITRRDGHFVVETADDRYETQSVLLAIGRRGTPRKLGVPGEDRVKVVYRLIDPEQYRDCRVLVVGGGDSALEAATAIADQPGTTVTLSYRGDAFSRAKEKNRAKVDAAAATGRLDVRLASNVIEIGEDVVILDCGEETLRLDNDAVIVCAGGILPTQFLRDAGIAVETKHGTA